MGVDDLISTETAVVATATAAIFSPRTRETLRKGAVFGVAGVLKVGDVAAGAVRGVVRGVKGEETMPTPSGNGSGAEPVGTPATRARRARTAAAAPTTASVQ